MTDSIASIGHGDISFFDTAIDLLQSTFELTN
jgi:hypothetical protein